MSAELLRRAAALMRERAEAVPPSPWLSSIEGRDHFAGDDVILCGPEPFRSDLYVRVDPAAAYRGAMTQDHIASWHPAVALAVADWLDATEDRLARYVNAVNDCHYAEEAGGDCGCSYKDCYECGKWHNCAHQRPDIANALAVARAYLGEDA